MSLAGIRVLDVCAGVAGPAAASYLAWLGADVTRVPPADDWARQLGGDLGRAIVDAGEHGKTVVDRDPRDLLAATDVLVCDWNPARQRDLGLSVAALVERDPALVVVAVTPYGLTGPDADRPGADLTAYHAGGEGYLLPGGLVHRAVPDRPPVRAGLLVADGDAGLAAAYGAVTALVRRARTGLGDVVDVSVVDVQLGEGRTTLGRAFFEGVDFDRTYAGYDYAGVLRCTDGWVCIRPSEERQWTSFCRVVGRDDLAADPRFATRNDRYRNGDALNAELEAWTTTVPRSVVRAAILEAGCPGGPYLEPAEVLTDPAVGSRDLFADVAAGGRLPWRPWHVAASHDVGTPVLHGIPGPGPLAGVRVLDLTWVAAGPYATELLAFAGAEVVKVESRTLPDLFRRPLEPGGDLDENIRFVDLNQGKASICVDLKSPEGLARIRALAATCDVLVENYRPGVRARLGLGDAELWALNPAMVVVAMSGFGAAAADADRPGYASIFSAESGLSAMTGWPDCTPADVRDTNDLRTGTLGALAVVDGLLDVLAGRPATSRDVAARDALVHVQAPVYLWASRGGPATRCGNALPGAPVHGVWRSADGWVAVAARTPAEAAAVPAELASWLAARPGAEAAGILCAAGVPAAVSAPAGTIRDDPHHRARRSVRPMRHPRLGELLAVGPPVRFDSDPLGPTASPPPLLGEHDDAYRTSNV